MVFPSLMFQLDQGMAAQFSAWFVLAFSFLIYRFKKIMIILFTLLGIGLLGMSVAYSIGPPSMNYQTCMNYNYCANNMNYYGQPWGQVPSAYFYPQLPFQSFWPQQNYFSPHAPSPYQSFDCPFCNQQQYYQQPYSPNIFQHPGGGAS